MKIPKFLIVKLLFVFFFCFNNSQISIAANAPTGLTINLLAHADQVFLNGYPVNTPLNEAVLQHENFQFAEIAQKQPMFGWIVNSEGNNIIQVAYQIIVASSLDNIEQDKGDCWDTGKTKSNQSINIKYEGNKLEPEKVYFWKVKTWDNHGAESAFSDVSQFKTAAQLQNYETARYPLQKNDEYPQQIKLTSSDLNFIDFGKDAFGRLRLNLFSKTGNESITIHLGEVVKNGRINPEPGGSRRYSKYELALKGGWNTYIIAIRPDKRNTKPRAIHMPEYVGDVTPFRYCEIEGYSHPLEKHQIVRETVFYPFDETESYFTSSDTILNQVWDLCKYSMKATSFTGTFVDGDRERIPYEADALINQLGYYFVARDYSIARHSHEYLINHATWPTEWILQSVLMAWNDYLYTGNKESLVQYYSDLKAKTLTSLADETGFISTTTGKVTPEVYNAIHLKGNLRDIVDWPHKGILGLGNEDSGETDGFDFRDINTVVNAYHYFALKVMGTIAENIGYTEDSKYYAEQAKKLKMVFNEKLIDKTHKIYIDGIGTDHASLHGNMFPLAFGLAPEKCINAINEFIQSRGLVCSVYGSQFLMEAIYDGNNAAYGLDLLTSTAERSWYNMIRAGSTISMEAWDDKYKPNQDWNHAWGAAPANIIPRKLMGIEPLEPGFGKMRIKPQPAGLKHAEIKCPTIRGDVSVAFKNEPGKTFELEVEIPANSSADIYLPLYNKKQQIMLNDKKVAFAVNGEYAVIKNVGSGKNTFIVSK